MMYEYEAKVWVCGHHEKGDIWIDRKITLRLKDLTMANTTQRFIQYAYNYLVKMKCDQDKSVQVEGIWPVGESDIELVSYESFRADMDLTKDD